MYRDNDDEYEDEKGMSDPGRQSRSQCNSSSYKDHPNDDVGSDTSSTSSSSSSTVERKRAEANNNAISMRHQQQYEQDEVYEDDENESRGLLSNMDVAERKSEKVAGMSSSQVAQKRQKRRRLVAGVGGVMAGLVMVGPCTAVAAGVAGAMLVKKLDRKKRKETLSATATQSDETELASLISPSMAQV